MEIRDYLAGIPGVQKHKRTQILLSASPNFFPLLLFNLDSRPMDYCNFSMGNLIAEAAASFYLDPLSLASLADLMECSSSLASLSFALPSKRLKTLSSSLLLFKSPPPSPVCMEWLANVFKCGSLDKGAWQINYMADWPMAAYLKNFSPWVEVEGGGG